MGTVTTTETSAAHGASTGRVWRVLLVDDDPAFLVAARRLVGQDARLAVVGETVSGAEALALARAAAPDAILLDVHMPGMDGFETAELLRTEHAGIRIVLTSTDDLRQYRRRASLVGSGFLPKSEWSADALVRLLEATESAGSAG